MKIIYSGKSTDRIIAFKAYTVSDYDKFGGYIQDEHGMDMIVSFAQDNWWIVDPYDVNTMIKLISVVTEK